MFFKKNKKSLEKSVDTGKIICYYKLVVSETATT